MFNNVALDVAIGLIFIFLMYSLLAATIHEALASVFAYRPRMLERALEQMLDGKNYAYNWWDAIANWFWWLFYRFVRKQDVSNFFKKGTESKGMLRTKLNTKASLFAANITEHPLYRRAADGSTLSLTRKPSYLGAATFTDIFIDVLKKKAVEQGTQPAEQPLLLSNISTMLSGYELEKSGNLNKVLKLYIEQANGNMEQFRRHIEDWYDFMMDRVGGWYKRQTSRILFTLGVILAISFNVDTIAIVRKLSTDDELRILVADNVAARVHDLNAQIDQENISDSAKTGKKIELLKKVQDSTLADINNVMGLGWGDFGGSTRCRDRVRYVFCKTIDPPKLTGFFITAFAISLGAPFWFDLLNKLVKLRGSGAKPEQEGSNGIKTSAKIPGKGKPLQESKA